MIIAYQKGLASAVTDTRPNKLSVRYMVVIL